jgi:cell division protein FtsA
LEKAERLVGVPIERVWVSLNIPHLRCEKSKGVVAISKSDGEITDVDKDRAIDAASALSVPPNYEVLHVTPIRYTVDNQTDVKDPIGMTGVRLEVEVLIIQALSAQLNNLSKAIHRTGVEIEKFVLAPMAAAEAVLSSKQKDLGAVVINLGASTTSLVVYEEGELLHTAVLPIGSEHITGDIAIGLRCPVDLAERIKIEFGSADPADFGKRDEVDISDLAHEEGVLEEVGRTVSRGFVAEIIEARVEEIFEKVDDELKKIERSGMLPAGAYLVGGGAKLTDLVEVAKKRLRLPASVASNKTGFAAIDKVNDPAYITALGLVIWGDRNLSMGSNRPSFGNVGSIFKKIKSGFDRFVPK